MRCDTQSMPAYRRPIFIGRNRHTTRPRCEGIGAFFLAVREFRRGDLEIKMITAAEYWAWAEESLECARNAANESSREAYIKFAESWLESALRAERLAALFERPSKEPIPTTDYEWVVLPPFGEWRREGTSLK
jgi:hypothetical protein